MQANLYILARMNARAYERIGMKITIQHTFITLIMCLLSVVSAYSIDNTYLLEMGVQAGVNYYTGDANPHIFQSPLETAGAQLRYKLDRRWGFTTKAYWSRFGYKEPNAQKITRPLIGIDVTAEFNFLEYGNDWEMGRIKPYTPYIFLGIGVGYYGFGWANAPNTGIPASLYFPFGIGFKWKFASRWGLNIAWQHNLYFKDNLENSSQYSNTHELNGSNILENDLTGQLTIGIVFDFCKSKRACTTCNFFN